MRFSRLCVPLYLLCTLSRFAVAESEGQIWIQGLSQGRLSDSLRLWVEGQPRYSLLTGRFTTFMVRPAIGWQIAERLTLWAGYAWTPSFTPTPRDEHRAWFQVTHSLNFSRLTLSQRFRLEGRFIERISPTAWRMRYLARLALPIANESPLSAILYDEIFISLNNAGTVAAAGFDQNRLFVGANYSFSPSLALDLGYLWNAIDRPVPQTDRHHHVMMLTLFHYFDA